MALGIAGFDDEVLSRNVSEALQLGAKRSERLLRVRLGIAREIADAHCLCSLCVGEERRDEEPEGEEDRERKQRTSPADGSNHVRHGRTRTCKCQVDDEVGTRASSPW